MSSIQKWPTVSEEDAGDFYIFRLKRVARTSPRTGKTSDFVAIDSADWCNILPITPEGNVVCIHQYRHGSDAITIEIPAGLVEPDEDDPLAAAERELLEETGYQAQQVIKLGVVEPNPAFMNNRCHLYLALGAQKIQEPQFDGKEDIETQEFSLEQLDEMVASGQITHSLVIANLYYFNQYRKNNPLVLEIGE